MRSIIFTSLLAILMAAPAFAAPPQGCYVRHYSPSHLAGQPAQVVASMWLSFRHSYGEQVADMGIVTANQGHVQRAGLGGLYFDQMLMCWAEKSGGREKWWCAVECDGGNMEIIRNDGKVLEFRTDYLMVGNTDECGGSVDLAEHPRKPVVYRLFRTDDAQCESN